MVGIAIGPITYWVQNTFTLELVCLSFKIAITSKHCSWVEKSQPWGGTVEWFKSLSEFVEKRNALLLSGSVDGWNRH